MAKKNTPNPERPKGNRPSTGKGRHFYHTAKPPASAPEAQVPPPSDISKTYLYEWPAGSSDGAWVERSKSGLTIVPSQVDLLAITNVTAGMPVFDKSTGTLYYFTGNPLSPTGTMVDWSSAGGTAGGSNVYNRYADLPTPGGAVKVEEGMTCVVRFHSDATTPMWRLYVATQVVQPAGGTGGSVVWLPADSDVLSKPLRSDTDSSDPTDNDIQFTMENGHKEIKIYDAAAGAWIVIYSEDNVKGWVAAGNSFIGTVQNTGHGTAGALDLATVTAEATLGATDKGHYFVWVGAGGYAIPANGVGGATSAIEGQVLNVGDWLQVSEPSPGVYRYTVIPGDLLAKARGDSLYGLNTWTSGAYEQGALTVFQGKIYKATQPILPADPSPTDAANTKWQVVDLSAGVRNVAADINLPTTAPEGDVYLVLNSSSAGGRAAFFIYDIPTGKWVEIGGANATSAPLDLSGGRQIYNAGSPIGSITAYVSQTPPAGWLLMTGQTIRRQDYPKLVELLNAGGDTAVVPAMGGQFIMGTVIGSPNPWGGTTAAPAAFGTQIPWKNAARDSATSPVWKTKIPEQVYQYGTASNGAASYTAGVTNRFDVLHPAGLNHHTHEIDAAGTDMYPNHVSFPYIIKADDIGLSLSRV